MEDVAAEGTDLRDARTRADYRLREAFVPTVARRVVADARSVIARIDEV